MTHYVVRVATTAVVPSLGVEGVLEGWMSRLESWHPSVSGVANHVVVTITLPAASLAQAVATGLDVVGQLATPLTVEAMPQKMRDMELGGTPVPEMMSVAEAADALGVSQQTVLQMIDEGKIPGTRVGRTYSVPRSAVKRSTEPTEPRGERWSPSIASAVRSFYH